MAPLVVSWTFLERLRCAEGVHRHRSLLWPSPDGDWLLYGVLNTSLCHRIDYVDYSDDLPRSHTLRYAVVSCGLFAERDSPARCTAFRA